LHYYYNHPWFTILRAKLLESFVFAWLVCVLTRHVPRITLVLATSNKGRNMQQPQLLSMQEIMIMMADH
jgi:hypothetical protein